MSSSSSSSDHSQSLEDAQKPEEPQIAETGSGAGAGASEAGDDEESRSVLETEWQPSNHEKAIIYTLAITSLVVALDATIIITPLSVSKQSWTRARTTKNPGE